MTPPGEITMVNLEGGLIRARVTQRDGGREFLYNPITEAFQYRVVLPDGSPSMIVTDVPVHQLREYVRTGQPVLLRRML